jgi:hypothetical protein
LSERLLGVDVQEVLGVSTFEEALVELFRGCETRTANIKANRTGLGITAVKRLAKWTFPSNGRTSSGVIIQILRHLMETRQPDKLDAFERAVASLEACGRKQRVTEPVFWHSVDVENEAPELTQREPKTTEPDPIPTPAPPRARRPRPRIHMLEPVDDLEEAHLEEMGASEYLQVSLMGAIGQITEILRLHPALIERLPDEWKGAGEQQNEGNCQRCPLEDALTGSDCSHSKERERAVIQRVRELEVILGVVCEWPPSARDRTLREMDDPIIRITDLLEAMGLKEPARFLADIALQREAEGLVGKSS